VSGGYYGAYTGYHTSEQERVSMVVVYVKEVGSNDYKRESFLDPMHYSKWLTLHKHMVVDIRPVGKRVKRVCG
jgi:hypothetical protein